MKNVSTVSYKNATGKIDYGFRNDYMFRAVLQTSKKTLTGLVSALLHINPADVKSIEIQNPIELGKVYDDKEFILDISLLLNDDTYINLEMQVSNQSFTSAFLTILSLKMPRNSMPLMSCRTSAPNKHTVENFP